jgi:hypothetical protein
MLYVCLLNWNTSTSPELREAALGRRAQWSYPAGAKQVAEYWLSSGNPAVIAVVEADSFEPLFELDLAWRDVFNIEIHPAVTADQGLQIGASIMQRQAQG